MPWPKGWLHSPEARARMSRTRTGVKRPEHAQAMRQYHASLSLNEREARKRPRPENLTFVDRTHSVETREKMSRSVKRYLEVSGPRRPVWKNTKLEQALVRLLEAAGFTVEREKQFGRFRVDCYVSERHLAFEADGTYHHSRPGRHEYDVARDMELLRRFDLPVVRLTEWELVA